MTTNGATLPSLLAELLSKLSQNSDPINENQFENFCRQAFEGLGPTSNGNERSPKQIFRLFDSDNDGKLKTEEEKTKCKKWLDKIRTRKSALIVVDVQNDFIDGSLSIRCGPAHQDPLAIIDPINHLIDTVPFDQIVYTFDWHPLNHISFLENISSRTLAPSASINGGWKMGDQVPFLIDGQSISQRVWPKHCVQNTWGAKLHEKLRVIEDENRSIRIFKGQKADIDSYSAFFDNDRKGDNRLHDRLIALGITDLYVCGLAYDVCVAWTAQDAVDLGYKVAVLDDCSAGLDVKAMETVKSGVIDRSGVVIKSDRVIDFVQGRRVPWSWAYGTAVRLFRK